MVKKYSITNKISSLGFLGIIRLLRDIFFSLIMLKFDTLMRWPFYIRNYGEIKIGSDFRSGPGLVIDVLSKEAKLEIGHSFRVASRLHIGCISEIKIGNNVLIASDVYISDHSHGSYKGNNQSTAISAVNDRELFSAPIIIGNNVWIGEKVCILPGVKVGENAIIGAFSVVTKDVISNSIYVGNPAKIIKTYDDISKTWVKIEN